MASRSAFDLESTKVDLREALIEYWMSTMQDSKVGPPERMKASECLAKYILGMGATRVSAPKGPARPPTADVLKLIAGMDKDELDAEEPS